ncbi:MAG: CUB domain-containing protein, partial [Bacteroidota bacterium]
TAPDYTFDDGSGYSYYPNNISCSYLIEHPENGPLDLQFTKWQLADAEDEVTIYDGKNENAPVLAKYDGTDTPALLTSSSNKVFITFETNDNGKDLGWDLKYSTKATTVKEHDWQKLTVAPNPAENQAIISGAPKGKLNVFSMDGRKVFHENNGIEDRYSLDVSNMPQGIYMVEIISEAGERNVQKLIVR